MYSVSDEAKYPNNNLSKPSGSKFTGVQTAQTLSDNTHSNKNEDFDYMRHNQTLLFALEAWAAEDKFAEEFTGQ